MMTHGYCESDGDDQSRSGLSSDPWGGFDQARVGAAPGEIRRASAPTACPARRVPSTRRTRASASCHRLVVEDLLDRLLEKLREREGGRQARVELAGLDRVDGLAGDAGMQRQVALGPAAGCAELADPVSSSAVPQPADH
jgi:hypothetical protein